MEKSRKKPSNPLGKNNWLIPTTDREKFFNISVALDESIPNSQEKTILTCGYGFLLISQELQSIENYRSYKLYVWKPESSKVIDLPLLTLFANQSISASILLSSPDNPGSMVLLFDDVLRNFIFYKFGEKQWKKRWCGKMMKDIGDPTFIYHIANCDGKLFATTLCHYSLMVIEKTRSKAFILRPLRCGPPSAHSPCIRQSNYLLNFCGQLCYITISWGGVNYQDIIYVKVSKLELSGNSMNWTEVKSAEGQAIFLGHNYSFSCSVNETEMEGGCIYVSLNERLYSVNIEDQSISVSLPLKKLLKQKTSPFLAMRDFRICKSQAKSEHTITRLEEGEVILMEENSEAQTKTLCEIDILELIAKNLYLIDYINFGSVCNTFRQAAPAIKWSEASFNLQSQLSPWLVLAKGNSCRVHTFIDPRLGGKYLINIPKHLLDTQICYSKDGWLLLCNHDLMVFYHPFRKRFISLSQESRTHMCCLSYSLSSSPTSLDSILVGCTNDSIFYFCLREGQWHEHRFPDYDFMPNDNNPIYFDGAFYFLDRDGKLGVFRWNIDNGQVSWEILTELGRLCEGFSHNYLLECDGNLVSVFVINQLLHICKLNFTTMLWEKVTNLENHALFVSPFNSFSAIPNSPYMQNKVFFRKLYEAEIIYYCLSTEKFYTCQNKQVVPDINNTTEFLFSTWVEPRW